MFGKTGFIYALAVLFVLFLLARRIVHSPFGLSLRAIKNNPLRAAAIGIPVNRRLIAIYTHGRVLCRRRRRAVHPDHARSPRSTCSPSSARPICCWCWSSAAPAISMAA